MCGLYYCHVKNCCRDYKLRLSDNVLVCVHSLDFFERFCVELNLLWFEGLRGIICR
jgi:hypothetical protein